MTDSLKDAFESTANENLWADPDSLSGRGSNMIQTRIIRQEIPLLLEKYHIRKLLDAPCGDVFWMRELFPQYEKNGIIYIGADIVTKLIEQNNKLASANVSFAIMDLTSATIPEVDMIFTRDCFIHLSFGNILRILENYKKSGAKYLLVNTYTNPERKNVDVDKFFIEGRMLNLQKFPFFFGKPMELIVEGCTEDDGIYSDKSLGLWKLSQINLLRLRFSLGVLSLTSLYKRGKSKIKRSLHL